MASATDAVVGTTHEENIFFWDQAAEGTFGYSYPATIGQEVNKMIAHARARSKMDLKIKQIRDNFEENLAGNTCKFTVICEDGIEFPVKQGIRPPRATMSHLAREISQQMGLDNVRVEDIRLEATVHDIDTIHGPSEIPFRPGKRNAREFGLVKVHCLNGYEMMKDVEFPWPTWWKRSVHTERIVRCRRVDSALVLGN